MLVLTPKDNLFSYDEAKTMWEKCKENLENSGDFENIVKNTHFYSFYVDKKLIGCIWFCLKDGEVFINAFADRNTHELNLKCLKTALGFYNCDIYAESIQKPAIYCILKCGFKKIDKNLFKYERR